METHMDATKVHHGRTTRIAYALAMAFMILPQLGEILRGILTSTVKNPPILLFIWGTLYGAMFVLPSYRASLVGADANRLDSPPGRALASRTRTAGVALLHVGVWCAVGIVVPMLIFSASGVFIIFASPFWVTLSFGLLL